MRRLMTLRRRDDEIEKKSPGVSCFTLIKPFRFYFQCNR
jgi:hypothetical protein